MWVAERGGAEILPPFGLLHMIRKGCGERMATLCDFKIKNI